MSDPQTFPEDKGTTPFTMSHIVVSLMEKERDILNGQKGVFPHSTPSAKDSKPNGTVTGYFSQGHPELRTGMEEHPRSYSTTGALPFGREELP